jgi:DNA-binding PucR family transcriptional regulator
MATVDLPLARRFVDRELGALAADDDTARRLAATVGVYLEQQCSGTATAKRLGLHENTIRYRVRQAEQLLGRPVDERTLELRVALALAGAVGR